MYRQGRPSCYCCCSCCLQLLPTPQILKQLVKLLSSYLEVDKGYTSRRALYEDQQSRDYDQLARFGEWDVTDEPQAEKLL